MRQLFLILLLLPLASAFSAQQIIDDSRITDVTVFLSGAQVTRTAQVNLKTGENTFRFNGLTRSVRGNSVQVTGSSKYVIQSVKHELTYLDNPANNERVEMLQDDLDDVKLKKALRTSLREVYQQEKDMLLNNKRVNTGEGVLLVEDLQEIADFFRSRLTEIETKLVEIQLEEREFAEEIDRIEREIQKLRGGDKLTSSFVDVVLDAPAAGKVNVEFSYMVSAAAWVPSYDVRAKDIDSPLELVYKGRVIQYTEVDWKDVNLTMSTGNPAAGGVAPELNPWYLYLQELNAYKKSRKSSYERQVYANQAPAKQEMGTYALIMEDREGDMALEVAANANTLTTEFGIAIPYDIPADNQYYDVEMRRITLGGYYEHFAIPKMDKDAFLLAGVTDWEQYSLLPGISNIYFQGTYVGEGFIDPAVTGDTLSISLGRDKGVPIKRERIVDQCKTATFGGKKTTTRAFRIETRNNKSVPVTLTIEDQVPLTNDNSIEVSVEELSGGQWDEETGKITWNVTLQPGESRSLDLRFVVKYPKKKIVAGL